MREQYTQFAFRHWLLSCTLRLVSLYENSQHQLPDKLLGLHEKQFDALGAPGTWYDGGQRLAIAAEARTACCAAGLQDTDGGAQALRDAAELATPARRIAAQLAANPQAFEYPVYQQALGDGLSDAEYVEIVGLVSRITNFDVFARGIGVGVMPLPAASDGEPTRARPDTAIDEDAWAPTVPNGKRGGEIGKALYGDDFQPYIIRSLSLVPDELRDHIELEEAQYLPLDKFFQLDYQHHDGLTRPQVEVVAGRVSAINECFY